MVRQAIHPEPTEQAPHADAQQAEQAVETFLDGMIALEHVETSRVTEAAPPTSETQTAPEDSAYQPSDEDIDPEITIGLGEDPGWLRQEAIPANTRHEGKRS